MKLGKCQWGYDIIIVYIKMIFSSYQTVFISFHRELVYNKHKLLRQTAKVK